jgi:hypothetical protein
VDVEVPRPEKDEEEVVVVSLGDTHILLSESPYGDGSMHSCSDRLAV